MNPFAYTFEYETMSQTMFDCFTQLKQALITHGLIEDARWLSESMTTAYTTSSEMYGELGEVTNRIHHSISSEAAQMLREEFADCERVVQHVWPEFRLDSHRADV